MSIPIEKVSAAGFEMHYFRFGSGEKTAVILPGLSIQSVMGSAQAVADEYAVMKDDFTVYLFDRRTPLPERYSIHDMAEDTVLAIESLGLKNICLFGASQGGMMALDIVINHPGLVSRLALGSTTPDAGTSDGEMMNKWLSLAKAGDRVGLYVEFGRAIYPPAVFEKFRRALASAGQSVTEEELARFVKLAEATQGFCVTDRLTEIRCPVLVLGAADDRILGADSTAKFMEKLGGRSDFRCHIYDGFGHAAFDTAPDYQDRLYTFFLE
jgi:Predicted hydrolases or acyltransferases (alpha/beta hydrolase superfamily)